MSEEDMNLGNPAEETGTSGEQEDSQNNNTQTASDGVNTPETGNRRDPSERFRQLANENRELKEKLSRYEPAEKQPSAPKAEVPADKVLAAKVDFLYKAPEHLKERADEIATYAAQYGVPMEDAIAIFDSKGKVSQADVDAANAADAEARQTRTGGTANPAARSEAPDVSKMKDEDLESKLNQAVAEGVKL